MGWIQNILALLRIVLPLDRNYSSIRVESNFVRAGFKNSFPVGTKVVFFGVLRFSFVDAFTGIRNATYWNSISCYVTTSNNTILLSMLSTNESRLILSCCHRCFLWFKFSEDKHWYSFMPPAFLFQRGCGSLGASTDKTPRWPPFQFPD